MLGLPRKSTVGIPRRRGAKILCSRISIQYAKTPWCETDPEVWWQATQNAIGPLSKI